METKERFKVPKLEKVLGKWYGIILLVFLAVVFWGVFKILTPKNFGNLGDMYSYIQSSLIYAVGACGFYFIVVMGLFDFSIGANVVLSSIVGVLLSKQFGYIGLLVGCLACGTLIGFLNGIIYIKLRIPSMIVTVGLMLLYESLGYFVAGGEKQTLSGSLQAFGHAPGNIILALIAFLIVFLILKYTRIGTYCNAIGGNEYAASNMGINVDKYKLIGFVLLHLFVGVMAVLSVSYGTSVTATTNMQSMSRNFTPLMGCFVAVAFKKYTNPVIAMVIGEFLIAILFNGFVALGAPTTIQNVVTGAALLIIVALTTQKTQGEVVK